MRLKNKSVNVLDLHREMWKALWEIDQYWRDTLGYGVIITSGNDGRHSAKRSDHYCDRAVDIRTWTGPSSGRQLSGGKRLRIYEKVKSILGKNWYVKNEATHFHLSYRPMYTG